MNKFIFSFYDKQIKKAPKQISCLLRLHDYKHIPVTATIAKFSIKIYTELHKMHRRTKQTIQKIDP